MYIVSGLLKEALLSTGLHELQILIKATELSDVHHPGRPTTALTQILLQSAEELI